MRAATIKTANPRLPYSNDRNEAKRLAVETFFHFQDSADVASLGLRSVSTGAGLHLAFAPAPAHSLRVLRGQTLCHAEEFAKTA